MSKDAKKIILSLIVCLFPLLPLFRWNQGYYTDWNNHLWMIGYTGEYFKHHLSMPLVFNAVPTVGIAIPLFYSTWLYPLIGTVSSFLGAAPSLRLMLLVLFLIQFHAVKNLFSKEMPSFYSGAIAALTVWAIYPLTCLYNRSAIPELFATSLLLSAACLIQSKKNFSTFLKASILLGLSFSSHPITALYGSGALALIFLFQVIFEPHKKKTLLFFSSLAMLLAVFLSPWLYLIRLFRNDLLVTPTTKHIYFDFDLNSVFARLVPFPYDARSLYDGIKVKTPFLDAQISIPIAILLFGFYFFRVKLKEKRADKEFLFSSLYFLFFASLAFYFSVNPLVWDSIKTLAKSIQFPYRLISYVNLFLLFSLYSLLKMAPRELWLQAAVRNTVIIALTLASLNVIQKFPRAMVISEPELAGNLIQSPKSLPGTDYSTPELYNKVEETEWAKLPSIPVQFSVAKDSAFGKTEAKAIDLINTTIIQTNVSAFPWNKIKVNGKEMVRESVFANKEHHLVLKLEKGRYKLDFEFAPNKTWLILKKVSNFAVLMTVILFILDAIKSRMRVKKNILLNISSAFQMKSASKT